MVELKVCRFGKSLGVVLPREVDHLQASKGTELFLVEIGNDDCFLISSIRGFEKKMAKAGQNREALSQLPSRLAR